VARIPFAVHSYKLDSLPASAQDLVNAYAETVLPGGRSEVLVRHVPGFVSYATGGSSKVWAACHFDGDVYMVTGGSGPFVVYKVEEATNTTGTATSLGSLSPGGSSPVYMAASATQLVIVLEPYAYVVTTGGSVTQITDADFPQVTSVAYIDGYFVFTKKATDRYIISALLDATSYDALDIATAEQVPDGLIRVFEHGGELWLFGTRSIEVARNTGNADFPFERQSGASMDVGTIAAQSVATFDGSVGWLGSDLKVYRSRGYRAERISTHAIEKEIQTFVQPGNAQGMGISFQGHEQYVLTFPSSTTVNTAPGRTFVYDATTQLWHKRASAFVSTVPDVWSPASAIRFGRHMLVGGGTDGNLYRLDQSVATENGTGLTAIATLPPQWADTGLGFAHRLELEMETGANASELNVEMQHSDDGGTTWAAAVARSMGASGETTKRVVWRRGGKFRQRVYRFTFGAGAKLALYGADLEATGTKG